MAGKQRLDLLLVELGLVASRSLAKRFIMAGQVRVDGQLVLKPSSQVETTAEVELDRGPRFVSRGGEKLAAALEKFPVAVRNLVCADVGASTGGFTDCLLQNGCARVYAIDVGRGLLHWRLRNDPRVVLMEGTNARYLESLPEPVHLVTIDASFISLRILLPVVRAWYGDEGDLIALVKPQFEAGPEAVSRGGVVRDVEVRRQILERVLDYARSADFPPQGLIRSPLRGPKGNIEFLLWCRIGVPPVSRTNLIPPLF